MHDEKMIKSEGKIINSAFNMLDDTAKLAIDIKGKQYNLYFSFKRGNQVLATQLTSNMDIKFKGILDDTKKEIINPRDIWVRIN